METGPANPPLFDEAHVEAGRRPVERRRIPRRATAHHQQVVTEGHRATTTCTVKATSSAIPHTRAEMIRTRVLTTPTVPRRVVI